MELFLLDLGFSYVLQVKSDMPLWDAGKVGGLSYPYALGVYYDASCRKPAREYLDMMTEKDLDNGVCVADGTGKSTERRAFASNTIIREYVFNDENCGRSRAEEPRSE